MKRLLIPLGLAAATLAGCAVDPYYGGYGGYGNYGGGYGGYGYGYPAPSVGVSVWDTPTYVSRPVYIEHQRVPRGERDRDRDGIPNRLDRDRDGDGVRNRDDARPNNPRRH